MGFLFGHRSIEIFHLNCLIDVAKIKNFYEINVLLNQD